MDRIDAALVQTQAARQAPDVDVVIERACGRHLVSRALADGATRINAGDTVGLALTTAEAHIFDDTGQAWPHL